MCTRMFWWTQCSIMIQIWPSMLSSGRTQFLFICFSNSKIKIWMPRRIIFSLFSAPFTLLPMQRGRLGGNLILTRILIYIFRLFWMIPMNFLSSVPDVHEQHLTAEWLLPQSMNAYFRHLFHCSFFEKSHRWTF